ncbi:Leucine-rich repeat - like 10 [Theobroma cacao]|nr:Leucine-rich repeat - like 10 [Theobroma cacao]
MPNLTVLDLHMNKFHGNIPDSFVVGNKLQILNLNNNDFDGPFPKSLENCHDLQVLNLGNNKINGTFPHWLGTLPQLQVLVLRSNYFHGQISPSENESHFSALRILDLSHNEFSGLLPTTYFKSFRGMMTLSNVQRTSMEDLNRYYHFSVLVTMKVSKRCGKDEEQEPPESAFHEEGIFPCPLDWKFVMMGYGCGLVLGLSTGYIMLTIGKPEWLVRMVQGLGYKILRRLKSYH